MIVQAGIRLCALQMLRVMPVQPVALPGAILSDLSLARYDGFSGLGEASALQALLQTEQAKRLRHGVHLIAVQSADGSLVVGGSHVYGDSEVLFLDIVADIYVMADADLTYPADRIHDLIAPILCGEADMVVGDRRTEGHYAKENKRAFHNFGNSLVRGIVNRLFGAQFVDVMSGYRAFSHAFVKSYPILVEGFQIETDTTLHALNRRLRIEEVSVEYRDRPAGSVSKHSTFADGARVIFTILQILRFYRPLTFFAGLALLFSLAGLIAAMPVFDE